MSVLSALTGAAVGALQGASNPSSAVQQVTVAQISIGNVSVDDEQAAYSDLALGGDGIITDFRINGHYVKDRKRYMAGVSSPDGFRGNASAFFQLAAPTLLWVVDWTAAKSGAQPEIPDPDGLVNPDWVLIDEYYEPVNIVVGADAATPFYRLSGMYVYGLRRPSDKTVDDIVFGRPPWLQDLFGRTMPRSKLMVGLSDYATHAVPQAGR
jgi:hypothetical protein